MALVETPVLAIGLLARLRLAVEVRGLVSAPLLDGFRFVPTARLRALEAFEGTAAVVLVGVVVKLADQLVCLHLAPNLLEPRLAIRPGGGGQRFEVKHARRVLVTSAEDGRRVRGHAEDCLMDLKVAAEREVDRHLDAAACRQLYIERHTARQGIKAIGDRLEADAQALGTVIALG